MAGDQMVLLSAPVAARRLFWHRHAVAAHQSFDTSLGVDDALLTRPERVAHAANFDVYLFPRGAGDHVLNAASAEDFGFGKVSGVNVGFHLNGSTCCIMPQARRR